MRIPKRLQPLVDDGLIDEVISRLMSGKEADVFIVRCGDNIRCAKVYKDAVKRSFKKLRNIKKAEKFAVAVKLVPWANAQTMAASNKKKFGKTPKSMRYPV